MPAAISSPVPAVLVKLGPLDADRVADLRPYPDAVPDPLLAVIGIRRRPLRWRRAPAQSTAEGASTVHTGTAPRAATSPSVS